MLRRSAGNSLSYQPAPLLHSPEGLPGVDVFQLPGGRFKQQQLFPVPPDNGAAASVLLQRQKLREVRRRKDAGIPSHTIVTQTYQLVRVVTEKATSAATVSRLSMG